MTIKVTAETSIPGFDSHYRYMLFHQCPTCNAPAGADCEIKSPRRKQAVVIQGQHFKRSQIAIWHMERDLLRALKEYGKLENIPANGHYSTT